MSKHKYTPISGSSKKYLKEQKKGKPKPEELDLEQRMGISFNTQFSYESAAKYDSIFSYGNQPVNPANGVASAKESSPNSHKYSSFKARDDDWNGSGDVAGRKANPSGALRQCLIVVSAFMLLLMFPVLGWIYVKRVKPHERLVVYRLGRRQALKGPGLTTTLPLIDKEFVVDLQETSVTIATLSGASKDGGLAEVEQVLLVYQVEDPVRVVTEVRDLNESLRHLLATSVLSEMRRFDANDMRSALPQIASAILYAMNDMCHNWGIRLVRAHITSAKVTCEAPSPASFLSKIDFTAVGRQLSMFAPMFQGGASASAPTSSSTAEKEESASSTAISSFFERLEEMKQMALRHQRELATAASGGDATGSPVAQEANWCDHVETYLQSVDTLLNADPEGSVLKRDLGNAVFQFTVRENSSAPEARRMQCFIDARRGRAGVGELEASNVDVIISLCVEDLLDMVQGKGSPIANVLSGRISVQGDLGTASKLKALKKHFQRKKEGAAKMAGNSVEAVPSVTFVPTVSV